MFLSPAVSPSFCSLRINSGLLYGLRASRCITLSLRGFSCKSQLLLLFDAQASFFGLDAPTPFLMLLRRDECFGLVSLARAGAGARTVTFLPSKKQDIFFTSMTSGEHFLRFQSSKNNLVLHFLTCIAISRQRSKIRYWGGKGLSSWTFSKSRDVDKHKDKTSFHLSETHI